MIDLVTTWLGRTYEFINDLWGITDYVATTRAAHASLGDSALRCAAALVLIVCTLAVSVRVVRLLLPDIGIPLRWASIIGVGMWISTIGFHALRVLGLFNLWAALVCCVALGAAAAYVGRDRAPLAWAFCSEWRALCALVRLVRRSRYGFVSCILFGAALIGALRALLIPPLGWDTLTYHGPRAAIWVQSGAFTLPLGPGPLDLYRHFFSGSEVLTAWAMLPFHSDLLVNASTIVQWLGLFVASWALARACAIAEPFAATSAGVVALIPTMQLEIGTAYTEIALCATLLTGCALVLTLFRRPDLRIALVAAAVVGLAAGIKVQGAPPVAIVLIALMARLLSMPKVRLPLRLGVAASVVLVAALPSLPWQANAWLETGYPLSPMPVEVFGTKLGEITPSLRWYQERPVEPYLWEGEKAAALRLLAPVGSLNEALGTLALIPVLLLPVGFVALLRRRPWHALLVFSAGLPAIAMHFSRSLTTPRHLWSVSVSRYLLLFLAFAVPLSLAFCRTRSPFSQLYRRILLIYPLFYTFFFIRWGWGTWEYRDVVVLTVLLILFATLVRWGFTRDFRVGAGVAVLSALLLCWLVQSRQDVRRYYAFAESFAMHTWPRYWAPAIPMIDEPEKPRKIAITGGASQSAHDWLFYGFMGSRFQNDIGYVPLTKDGSIAHFGPHGSLPFAADRESWLRNLRTRGITEVMSFEPRSIELQWMEELPSMFERSAGSYHWGLFKVLR